MQDARYKIQDAGLEICIFNYFFVRSVKKDGSGERNTTGSV